MSKCAILTFNQAINYGAVLQMYALQQIILYCGDECEILDYRSQFFEKLYKRKSIKDWMSLRNLYHFMFKNNYIKYNYDGFSNFIHTYVNLTKDTYSSPEQLETLNNKYDCFIVGSDQVFNMYCNGNDDTFFLNFVKDEKKKNSYAASVGLNEIPFTLKNKYYKLLKNFNNLSIREKTGCKIISELIKRNCKNHIDPTLLIEKNDWDMIAKHIYKNEKYILVYVIAEDKKLFSLARMLAKKKRMKIIYINDRLFKQKGMINKRLVTPEEWIGLFMDAAIIVTNSFHGIAFSVNFEKEFYPFLLTANEKVNSRIVDFLKLVNLDSMIIDSEVYIKKIITNNKIDYKKVHSILNRERKYAKEYIQSILNK